MVIGFSQAFRLNLGGQLTVLEIISLAGALLAVLNPPPQGWLPVEKLLFKGLFAWLVVQILTDVVRDIPLVDMAKGVARIITFGAAYICISAYIIQDFSRLGGFLVGLALSVIASFYLYTAVAEVADPWKLCWGAAITYALPGVMLWFRWSKAMVWQLCFLALAAAHFAFNFRSLGAICLLAGVAPWAWHLIRPVPIWVRIAVTVSGVALFSFVYGQLAAKGTIGEAARLKYEMQAKDDGGPLSLLRGGRSEYKASFKAIRQSPIVGYGSWARHPEFVYELHDAGDGEFRVEQFAAALELGIIPTHSHLFGAWVDGGIIPAIGWLGLWFYLFWAINRCDWTRFGYDPFVLLLGLGVLWAILFSPFGTGSRITTALSICVVFHRLVCDGQVAASCLLPKLKNSLGNRPRQAVTPNF